MCSMREGRCWARASAECWIQAMTLSNTWGSFALHTISKDALESWPSPHLELWWCRWQSVPTPAQVPGHKTHHTQAPERQISHQARHQEYYLCKMPLYVRVSIWEEIQTAMEVSKSSVIYIIIANLQVFNLVIYTTKLEQFVHRRYKAGGCNHLMPRQLVGWSWLWRNSQQASLTSPSCRRLAAGNRLCTFSSVTCVKVTVR